MNTPIENHLSNGGNTAPGALIQTTEQVKSLLLEITGYSEKLDKIRGIILSSLEEGKEININYSVGFSNETKISIKNIKQFDNLRNYAKGWLNITQIAIGNEVIDLRTLN